MQRLYIKSVSASDSGVYTCQYTATNGSIVSKSFTLNVIVGKTCIHVVITGCFEFCFVVFKCAIVL